MSGYDYDDDETFARWLERKWNENDIKYGLTKHELGNWKTGVKHFSPFSYSGLNVKNPLKVRFRQMINAFNGGATLYSGSFWRKPSKTELFLNALPNKYNYGIYDYLIGRPVHAVTSLISGTIYLLGFLGVGSMALSKDVWEAVWKLPIVPLILCLVPVAMLIGGAALALAANIAYRIAKPILLGIDIAVQRGIIPLLTYLSIPLIAVATLVAHARYAIISATKSNAKHDQSDRVDVSQSNVGNSQAKVGKAIGAKKTTTNASSNRVKADSYGSSEYAYIDYDDDSDHSSTLSSSGSSNVRSSQSPSALFSDSSRISRNSAVDLDYNGYLSL